MVEAQCSGLKCIISDGVPPDVIVTDNVVELSLETPELWIDECIEISKGYERENNSERLKMKGLDTELQIHDIISRYE